MEIPKLFMVVENDEKIFYALKQVHDVKTVAYKNEIYCFNTGYTHLFSDDWFKNRDIVVLIDSGMNMLFSKEELSEEMKEICHKYFVQGGIYTNADDVYYCDIRGNIGYFTNLENGKVKEEYLLFLLPWIAERGEEFRKA